MRTVQSLLSLILAGLLASAQAAGPSIGIAIANGDIRIGNSKVYGNATLFDGVAVATGISSSELELNNGTRMLLASESSGRIYRDRLVLEKGQAEIENAGAFRVEALRLRLAPAPRAGLQVALVSHRVQVAALRGPVEVSTLDGAAVALVRPGTAVELDPQAAGAAAPFTFQGILAKKDGRYYLNADGSGLTIELLGAGLDPKVGKCVKGTGAPDPAAKAVRVIEIAERSDCASAPAAAAPHAGMSTASKAVIAGVVVGAATAGTLAITRDKDKDKDTKSRGK